MRYAYQAYASHTVILDIFQTNPFVQPTFLLQLKKVGKKSRSRAMLFIRLFCELSRSFALAPGSGKLNLHPCKLTYEISEIIGEHNARVGQKHRFCRLRVLGGFVIN